MPYATGLEYHRDYFTKVDCFENIITTYQQCMFKFESAWEKPSLIDASQKRNF